LGVCMIDLYLLFEFSRSHCGAICAVLVPVNLLTTGTTLLMLFGRCSEREIRLSGLIACGFALIMIAHVGTWLMIGVIMLPTFILLGLASLCLIVNLSAIAFYSGLEKKLPYTNWL